MYTTKITSQGTITLPLELRRKYNLHIGEVLTIEDTGKIIISKTADFALLRKKNNSQIKNSVSYTSGDGMTAHVREKYEK